MPKKTAYPRLHTRIKKGKAGQVYTYYSYDMRRSVKLIQIYPNLLKLEYR